MTAPPAPGMPAPPVPAMPSPLAHGGAAIELDRVSRSFGAQIAVRAASLHLAPGALHAIIGENGAGKSTLLKLSAGVLAPDAGIVRVDGAALRPATPAEAARRGVGMVHQHFMLVGSFLALENVVLGCEPVLRGGRIDLAGARARAGALMQAAGLEIPLDAITSSLTVGERQKLEILRVLYRGARAILLDEPTAVLSPLEADALYATLRRLVREGHTVAVVTHRLDEVIRFADHVTVMRRGQVVLSRPTIGWSTDAEGELTRAIMGGEPPPRVERPPLPEDAPAALEIAGLTVAGAGGQRLLDGVTLTVRAGEIAGVAGVEGNGQRELVRALAGMEPRAAGRVTAFGVELSSWGIAARRACLGVVHEDRHAEGLLLDASVGDNLVLGDLAALPRGARGRDAEAALIARRIARFGVVPPDPSRLAGELSGGNQQKIVVARALDRVAPAAPGPGEAAPGPGEATRAPRRAAAILAQPTRGVDVGAAAVIHGAIAEAARAGLAVLVISADLGELRRLCHRIFVMRKGRIVATLPPACSDEQIGRAMLGVEAA
ncbi:ABC transporter ATP-binding protein [Sorangium atrum]|uniref:ATP-binding cassette domain-containing protein n=1 Tax=Sorangium atrum TaxID=2995308 RepID=A0ABT5BV48_9BACT|nr:ATP-binding cassette domain-containing protein [Sorangium aterium]MDC0678016.1 ATP-binding cassette domain-containing protein [Sorangium aterium]